MNDNPKDNFLTRIASGMTTQNDAAAVKVFITRYQKARRALEFYANQTNYYPCTEAGQTAIDLDDGEQARDALE